MTVEINTRALTSLIEAVSIITSIHARVMHDDAFLDDDDGLKLQLNLLVSAMSDFASDAFEEAS